MLVATFQLEFEAIALRTAFEDVPQMEIEVERIAAHSTEWVMPCLWVSHDDFGAVDRAFAADPTTREIIDSEEFDGEAFYHVDWDDAVIERLNRYIDKGGSILSATATRSGWEVQMRFVSRDQFDTFRGILRDRDYAFQLLDLSEPGSPRTNARGVTPRQRKALLTAAEMGYFEVPRAASSREVAEAIGTSQQALSELLRRGSGNLVTATLETTDGETSG